MNQLSLAAVSGICLAALAGPSLHASTAEALEKIEPRFRAIYERGEFRAKPFRAEWLPDSSGYLVQEPNPETDQLEWARYDTASGNRTVTAQDEQPRNRRQDNVSPDGRNVVFSRQGGLSLRNTDTGKVRPLIPDTSADAISNGRARWSPDGKRIAFVQSDRSLVRMRSMLIPGDPSYPEVRETRFARVGGAITKLTVGVVEVADGKTNWLPIPTPSEGIYLGQVEWAGNSHELLVEKLNRFRNQREFLLVDVRTNTIRTLFSESDPAWVVASYGKNSGLEWIRNGQAFVVITEKDGWRHAYTYSRDGKEETLLTPGEYDIIERGRIDEERGWYYFNASPDHGAEKYLYRAPLNGNGKVERVTPKEHRGTHDYTFSPDSRWAFHTYSTFDSPPITELISLPEHRVLRTVEDNHELQAKAKALIHHPTEFLQLDIGDGIVMDAWMIKPPHFDPARKYPVLVYVYGEPHAQTVLNAWGKVQSAYHRAVAELGYLVVSIDNRGTPAPKGAAWRRAVFGSLGPLSTEEQAKGIQELARTRPYVDLSRVAIWGWSGGGSNTLNAMFRRPDVYQVGIAVAPKPQAHLYNAWFQEIYMETRETNPEGYEKASAINYAEGLQGDLLIIHGSGETNTHLEIVEGLVDRLIELGKPFDYMVYPNRDHGIRKGPGTSVHLRMHMVRYLLNHLAPGPR